MQFRQKTHLFKNMISSLVLQITAVFCGFILPRMILTNFGSQVNGLINSITQFLSIITFLELGVGAVVQSSLYKPLANHCSDDISRIIASANNFFRTIAHILLFYVIGLIIFYPMLVDNNFDSFYIDTLIIVISVNSFVQYYFGIVDGLLLSADQRGYISSAVQIFIVIFNTIICTILIRLGVSIHILKTATSLIYMIRPVFIRFYVNRHYEINRNILYTTEPISQKWNGVSQHIAFFVLEQTDIIVLTVFSSLSNVSIYSVYHMVIYGVKNLLLSLTSGIQSLMGEYFAKEEIEKLRQIFDWSEWLLHTGTILVFGCTSVLIVPFISIYTKNIIDSNAYIVPIFAVCITLSHAVHCLRLPYNILILAAGHYRQTQKSYIVSATLNIIISILMVHLCGLVGVAVGTLIAMLYQTIWMSVYDANHILKISIRGFSKHMVVDSLIFFISYLLTYRIHMSSVSYLSWIKLSVFDVIIWGAISAIINYIFYPKYIIKIIENVTNKRIF